MGHNIQTTIRTTTTRNIPPHLAIIVRPVSARAKQIRRSAGKEKQNDVFVFLVLRLIANPICSGTPPTDNLTWLLRKQQSYPLALFPSPLLPSPPPPVGRPEANIPRQLPEETRYPGRATAAPPTRCAEKQRRWRRCCVHHFCLIGGGLHASFRG